jgi:RHS repeat-associated protein
MNLNGTEYLYTRNLQGDITGLIDSAGAQVVSYSYDAWGNVLSITGSLASTLGQKNPYKYRGYRLDSETGMYYLNSRYYVPEWGRMLNADANTNLISSPQSLADKNLYLYCGNNPINSRDDSGRFVQIAIVLGGAVVGGLFQVFENLSTGQPILKDVAGAMVGGAVGVIVGAIPGAASFASLAAAAAESIVNESIKYLPYSKNIPGSGTRVTNTNLTGSVDRVIRDTFVNGVIGHFAGKIVGAIKPGIRGAQSNKVFSARNRNEYGAITTENFITSMLKPMTEVRSSSCSGGFGGGTGGGHYAM